MGSKKAKKQTVGFEYTVSMHMGLTHGPIDFVNKVMFGDKVAWKDGVSYNRNNDSAGAVIGVDQKGLFGGLETGGEGGVFGVMEIGFGSQNQQIVGVRRDGTYDADAQLAVGINVPDWPQYACNYRGMAVLMLHGWNWGTNPYLKNVSVECSRFPFARFRTDDTTPDIAVIGKDANPAFIIMECATNSEWGMGYPASSIDTASVYTAAQRLYTEGFGLSLIMQSQQTVEDFINEICEHVDATFYFRPSTGLWTVNLIRPDDVPKLHFTQGNCRLTSFSRRLLGETVNQITVKYTDPETEDYATVGVQDDANIEAQGQPVPGTKEYRGIRNSLLALRAAQRDLRLGSACLATAEIVSNRYAWSVIPGDTVLLSHGRLKISGLRMRVSEVKHAEAGSGKITISLVEDVFGQLDDPFSGASDRPVVEPPRPPGAYESQIFWEVPFWFVVNNAQVTGASSEEISAIDPLSTWVSFLLRSTNSGFKSSTLAHEENLPSGPVFEGVSSGGQTPSAVLGAALPQAPYSSLTIKDNFISAAGQVKQDPFIVIGEGANQEIARIVSVRNGSGVYSRVQRGIMDTHPRAWPAGTRIFFVSVDTVLDDPSPRPQKASQRYKIAMYTSEGYTADDAITPVTVFPSGRQGTPYPAANVTLGGLYWPTAVKPVASAIQVAWASRNRKLQDANAQVDWTAGPITPEPGTTYSVYVQNATTGAELGKWSGPYPGVDGVSVTVGTYTGPAKITISAFRDDTVRLGNFQDFVHTFTITAP
jgi:hypothetical protein